MDTQRIKSAIAGALVSKGTHKGSLKKQCPPIGTDAAAAWQAIMFHANPYKVGLGHYLFMPDEIKENVYKPIIEYIKFTQVDVRSLDRDRRALELINAW